MTDTHQPQAATGSRRRLALLLIALAALALAMATGLWWALYGRTCESTDNAYVRGDVALISAQTSGTATQVSVDDTDMVKPGATLIELDPTDARLGLATATQQLALAVRSVSSLFAEAKDLQAQVTLRQAEASRANQDLQRRRAVASLGGVSGEDLHHAEQAAQVADAGLRAAQARQAALLAKIDGTTVQDHPQVSAAAQRVREAYLALARTKVVAPIAGMITKRAVQVGQHVQPGTALMGLVALDRVWVEANFKESQLGAIRVGQAVQLHADLYGDQVTYHGRVQGIDAGSGAAFATIPAQNATGNWIKVVQRVPVRIALDPVEVLRHPLRIGLSMTATVRLDGEAAALAPRTAQQPTQVYSGLDDGSDALIRKTIDTHLKPSALAVTRSE
ncbi:efflux RND transporter periplasmic adaptor subunit [Pseudomonas putida]